MALLSEKERELRAMFKAFREHVQKNADHVGERFPDEARKMHYGEIEHRSIYGEASPMEARELIEEGIEIHPSDHRRRAQLSPTPPPASNRARS